MNLTKIIEKSGIDRKVIASALFPDNKFPVMSLKRVEKGDGLLNTEQVAILAKLIGVNIADLFQDSNWEWKGHSEEGIITFESGDWKAKLDTKEFRTWLFHKGALVADEVIHSRMVPLSDYIEGLNRLINKNKNHEQRNF